MHRSADESRVWGESENPMDIQNGTCLDRGGTTIVFRRDYSYLVRPFSVYSQMGTQREMDSLLCDLGWKETRCR